MPQRPAQRKNGARARRWRLAGCRRGSPALEFALISPVLVSMLLVTFDIGELILTRRGLTMAAQEIAEAAGTFAAGSSSAGIITSTQANQAMSIAFAKFPGWLGSGGPSYGVTLSSIAIVTSPSGCTTGCSYSAQTAWSIAINGGQTVLRNCGSLTSVANGSAPSLTTLPVGLFNPPSILVVDISVSWTPTFYLFLKSPVQMMQSAYMPARSQGSYVQLTVNGSYTGQTCNGYP